VPAKRETRKRKKKEFSHSLLSVLPAEVFRRSPLRKIRIIEIKLCVREMKDLRVAHDRLLLKLILLRNYLSSSTGKLMSLYPSTRI
jgi:hypothetical protein